MPPPGASPPPGSRSTRGSNHDLSAEERVHRLIEWLRSGRRLTTTLAAEAFGVSRRTIARDLTYLREALALEVTFEPARNSYVLAEEHTALPYLAFPTLVPVLLGARPDAPPSEREQRRAVNVRFSARAVRAYVARGGRLPAAPNEDGTLDVCFTPHNLDEFMSYVLSRGPAIEVLGPADFRHHVIVEIRRMLSVYENEHPSDA